MLSQVNGESCRAYVAHDQPTQQLAVNWKNCVPPSIIIAAKGCTTGLSPWCFQKRVGHAKLGWNAKTPRLRYGRLGTTGRCSNAKLQIGTHDGM